MDWWGIGASPTPTNSFSLTNATIVTSPTATTTGTITPDGSIAIKNDGYFHVSADYNGQTINSSSTCTDTTIGGQSRSTGSWSAMATYPSQSDLPPAICVNMYDEHGNEGQPSGSTNDFSAINDNDNSIQTNAFNPALGAGYCATPTVVTPPSISLLKQVCKVAAAKCSKSVSADWVKARGAVRIDRSVADHGHQHRPGDLDNVTVADPNAPACAGLASASLAPGTKVVETCDSLKVTKGFKNVATVTGAPPSGAMVTASSSATVSVIKPPPGITTSQSLTPNDEGFVNNGQEATGTMTFKLFPA